MMSAFLVLVLLFLLALIGMSYWISTLLLYGHRHPLTRTPAEYGLAYEDVTFRSKDGLSLQGWWLPAAATQRNRSEPVVILLHPFLGNRHGLSVQQQGWPRLFTTEVDLLKLALRFLCSIFGATARANGGYALVA